MGQILLACGKELDVSDWLTGRGGNWIQIVCSVQTELANVLQS
jgi:hypothetical protein